MILRNTSFDLLPLNPFVYFCDTTKMILVWPFSMVSNDAFWFCLFLFLCRAPIIIILALDYISRLFQGVFHLVCLVCLSFALYNTRCDWLKINVDPLFQPMRSKTKTIVDSPHFPAIGAGYLLLFKLHSRLTLLRLVRELTLLSFF